MNPLPHLALLAGLAATSFATEFEPPVQLTAAGEPIKLEQPGFASPCWADIDGDGKKDLLVGQFKDGKIKVYSGADGITKLPAGEWLQADGKPAKIPGVW